MLMMVEVLVNLERGNSLVKVGVKVILLVVGLIGQEEEEERAKKVEDAFLLRMENLLVRRGFFLLAFIE